MTEIKYPHIDKPWMKFYDEKSLKRDIPNTNLADYIKLKNRDNMNSIATTYYTAKTSYKDMFERIDNFSKMLISIGVKKGSRIMYLVPNIPESGELFLASSQIGAVSDFVDPRPDSMDLEANAKKILELIKHEKADFIIALDKCYLAMLKPIENELKDFGIDQIITISANDSMNLIGKIDYLLDVIKYNELKNARTENSSIQKLKWYQAVLKKIEAMKKEDTLYEEAVKSSPLKVLKSTDILHECQNVHFDTIKDENLLSYIGHTSGTSGARPKPITLTNKNQISATEQLFKANANFNRGDKILHELPFFSPLGADNNFILNLASGSNNIDIPEFEINEFGYLVKKYHPNVILGTPSWLASLPECDYLNREDLSCITRIIYGGDSMNGKIEERINKWLKLHGSRAEVEKGHGMSEYCGCGSYAKGEYNEYETIGIPLPDTIYSIVNPSVEDHLEPLEFKDDMEFLEGELVVSSDAVTDGKLDSEVVVPHYEMDGNSYIRTRDLVKMDRCGVFSFNSRKDRSFTRFDGYKVKPFEIEKVIKENPNVKECCIVQYYDKVQRGLMPIVHIVLSGNTTDIEIQIKLTEEIVYKQIIANPNMSSRQIPSKFKFRNDLPLTKNGKTNFNKLIEEGLTGDEINVDVAETNLAVESINIYSQKQKTKQLIKR